MADVKKPDGQWKTFQDWVNFAERDIGGLSAVCYDSKGRKCIRGADFMRADKDNAFPVNFWFSDGKIQTVKNFYNKLSIFSSGRCSAVKSSIWRDNKFIEVWLPKLAGEYIATGECDYHSTKESALQEAKHFKQLCKDYKND